MSTNSFLMVLSIVLVAVIIATVLWAFIVAPFWVPWHSGQQR